MSRNEGVSLAPALGSPRWFRSVKSENLNKGPPRPVPLGSRLPGGKEVNGVLNL